MNMNVRGFTLNNVGKVNVVVGENGSGKSTLLREIDTFFQDNRGLIKYISPERGGTLKFDACVENNMQDDGWKTSIKRRNSVTNFREMSMAEFKNLEVLVLRKIEADSEVAHNKPPYLAIINAPKLSEYGCQYEGCMIAMVYRRNS